MGPSLPQLIVTDDRSGTPFLIDTGAQVSLLPRQHLFQRSARSSPPLQAANGSAIATYGCANTTILIGGKKFPVKLIIADVRRPILGADFLRTHNLLVDVRGQRLIDATTFSSLPCAIGSAPSADVAPVTADAYSSLLLAEYPELLRPTFTGAAPAHGVFHHIETRGPPVHAKARRLPPDKLAFARSEFRDMERMGIIAKSCSPWSSALHMVRKDCGSWRPCGDYRRLNDVTVPDRYPLPHLQDCTALLAGCSVFSKVDLIRGYHQVPIAPGDVHKTAITTPFGLWEFRRMPFGLRNAAQTFQRLMHNVLQDLPFIFVYLDDILVASRSPEEHLHHLRALFNRLRDNSLIIKLEKCQFGRSALDFLGHRVSSSGCTPLPTKVKAIRDFPQPSTVSALQRFLGVLNFYHRFISHAADLLHPLHVSLRGKKPLDRLHWTPAMQTAFQEARTVLSDATLLCHPVPGAPLALSSDASDIGMGAVLEQLVHGRWQPLAFYSRQFQPAETRYSTFDRELLALHSAVQHFRDMLEGRPFTAFTDHKPLVDAMHKTSLPASGRQQRHLATISEFTTDIRHVSGKYNTVADTLSRTAHAVCVGLDYHALAAAQRSSMEIAASRTAITGLQLHTSRITDDGPDLLCDVSRQHPRPLVPPGFRRLVFDLLHGLSHPSVRGTKKLISDRFVWHRMNADITKWCQECLDCQSSKTHRHHHSPPDAIPIPGRRFSHVHVDLVGPLPPSSGFSYLLTAIDRTTRWPEAFPLTDITASSCAQAFIAGWVSRFGVPLHMTTDRGRQFTSALWDAMATTLGTSLHHTTSYHPQSNGIVERWHRSLKAALKARLTGPNWVSQLPWVLLGLRSAHKDDLGCSPAELVFGDILSLPGELVERGAVSFDPAAPGIAPSASNHSASRLSSSPASLNALLRSRHVFVRVGPHTSPLQRPYEGPYPVIEAGPKHFIVQVRGQRQTISIDRLKPAVLSSDSPDLPCAPQLPTTRHGRVIRPPVRFSDGDS